MSDHYKIGFANLNEANEYALKVRQSLEACAAQDHEVELVVRDNALDDDKALANAAEFAENHVDLVIMYHINERLSGKIRSILKTTPLIAVDIPIPFTIYVGIDNVQMGQMAAEALRDWIHQHGGTVDKLLGVIDSRVVGSVRERVNQVENRLLEEAILIQGNSLFVDASFTPERNYDVLYQALKNWADFERIAIVGYNDQTTLDALQVVEDLNMAGQVAVVGHAASDLVIEKMNDTSSLIACTLSYPEKYGAVLYDVARRMLDHERVPAKNHVPLGLLQSSVNHASG